MAIKHTPGPWSVETDTEMIHINSPLRPVFEAFGLTGTVAICSSGPLLDENDLKMRPEDEANAKLIAAAPDLLAALEQMLEEHGHYDIKGTMMARAAIVKANG